MENVTLKGKFISFTENLHKGNYAHSKIQYNLFLYKVASLEYVTSGLSDLKVTEYV